MLKFGGVINLFILTRSRIEVSFSIITENVQKITYERSTYKRKLKCGE